jgi:hypothetical protein
MLKSIQDFLQSEKLFILNHSFIFLCSAYILSDLLSSSKITTKSKSKLKASKINEKKSAKKTQAKIEKSEKSSANNNIQQPLLNSKSLVYEDLELELESQDPREPRKISENMREITTNKGLEPLKYVKIVVSGGPCAGKTTSNAKFFDFPVIFSLLKKVVFIFIMDI